MFPLQLQRPWKPTKHEHSKRRQYEERVCEAVLCYWFSWPLEEWAYLCDYTQGSRQHAQCKFWLRIWSHVELAYMSNVKCTSGLLSRPCEALDVAYQHHQSNQRSLWLRSYCHVPTNTHYFSSAFLYHFSAAFPNLLSPITIVMSFTVSHVHKFLVSSTNCVLCRWLYSCIPLIFFSVDFTFLLCCAAWTRHGEEGGQEQNKRDNNSERRKSVSPALASLRQTLDLCVANLKQFWHNANLQDCPDGRVWTRSTVVKTDKFDAMLAFLHPCKSEQTAGCWASTHQRWCWVLIPSA